MTNCPGCNVQVGNVNRGANLRQVNVNTFLNNVNQLLAADDQVYRPDPDFLQNCERFDESWMTDKYPAEIDSRGKAIFVHLFQSIVRLVAKLKRDNRITLPLPANDPDVAVVNMSFSALRSLLNKDLPSAMNFFKLVVCDLARSHTQQMVDPQSMRRVLAQEFQQKYATVDRLLADYDQRKRAVAQESENTSLLWYATITGNASSQSIEKTFGRGMSRFTSMLREARDISTQEILQHLETAHASNIKAQFLRDLLNNRELMAGGLRRMLAAARDIGVAIHRKYNLRFTRKDCHEKITLKNLIKGRNVPQIKFAPRKQTRTRRNFFEDADDRTGESEDMDIQVGEKDTELQKAFEAFQKDWKFVKEQLKKSGDNIKFKFECENLDNLKALIIGLDEGDAYISSYVINDNGSQPQMEEVVMRSLIEALATMQSEWIEKYSSIVVPLAISKQQKPRAFYQTADDGFIAVEEGLEADLRRHARLDFERNQHGDIEVNVDYLAAKYAAQMFVRCSPLQSSALLHFSDSPSKSLKQLVLRLRLAEERAFAELPALPVQSEFKQVVQLETVIRIICCSIEDRACPVDANDSLDAHVSTDIQSLVPLDILKNIKVCDLELVRRRIQLEKYKDRITEWDKQPNFAGFKHDSGVEVPLLDQVKQKAKNNKNKFIELLKIQFVDVYTTEAKDEQLKSGLQSQCEYTELDELFEGLNEQEQSKLQFCHLPALIHRLTDD